MLMPAVCDPVMGDHGKLYVKPEVVPCYQEIVPLATIMTPNQFEAEKLVGERIVTEEDALAACIKLHNRGVATVVSIFCHTTFIHVHLRTYCCVCCVENIVPSSSSTQKTFGHGQIWPILHV